MSIWLSQICAFFVKDNKSQRLKARFLAAHFAARLKAWPDTNRRGVGSLLRHAVIGANGELRQAVAVEWRVLV
jgi:hypothetical protein